MVGFYMDPVYGGNSGKVGWKLTGFTGADMGNSFNNGRNVMKLMVANQPTRLSASQFRGAPESGWRDMREKHESNY